MTSGYHQEVQDHYERHPYPHYPFYSLGSWSALNSVDCKQWGLRRELRDIWIAGAGTIAPLMFGRRNYQARILATDISDSALRIALRRLNLFGIRNVQMKKEDLFHAQYVEAFDAVDAYGVIHHTISPQKSYEILVRSLRPQGVLRLMVYSEQARAEIEKDRAEVRGFMLRECSEVVDYLKKKGRKFEGDYRNMSGIADALLNPMVHVFNDQSLEKLLNSQTQIEILRVQREGNFVAWVRKL